MIAKKKPTSKRVSVEKVTKKKATAAVKKGTVSKSVAKRANAKMVTPKAGLVGAKPGSKRADGKGVARKVSVGARTARKSTQAGV